MKVVGAIDIGSNAVRMSCARLTEDHRIEPIESLRTPIRLGADVFEKGYISDENIEKLLETFKIYIQIFAQNKCEDIRAYATSAFRETSNQEKIIQRITEETGITLDVISGGKEAQLLESAIMSVVDLRQGTYMLADLGGGSLEITILKKGKILYAESFRLGTVRLLRMFPYSENEEEKFLNWARSYVENFLKLFAPHLQKFMIDHLFITGGNASAVAQLKHQLIDAPIGEEEKKISYVSKKEFKLVQKEVFQHSLKQRIERLGLATDRADVILPAICVFKKLLNISRCKGLTIPNVGLRDGILNELLENYFPSQPTDEYEQIINSAYYYAQKYRVDQRHAEQVHRLSIQLFEGTKSLHQYANSQRWLLEVAAILHDIGRFIRHSQHQQHTMYLIQNIELVGMTNTERYLISLIARYHSRSIPSDESSKFSRITSDQKKLVNVLAAILRIADALDRDHQSAIQSLEIRHDQKKVYLGVGMIEDRSLMDWAVRRKKDLFESVFQRKLSILERFD